MLDVVRGLRILGDIESTKGQLYDWFSELFAPGSELSALFGRMALDQVAHRNVIQYQTRIVMRNPKVFRSLRIDFQELNGICSAMESFREACPHPGPKDALQAALDFESLSLALFDQDFFRGLHVHFGPFVDNIQAGISKHMEQLRKAAGRQGEAAARRMEPVETPSLADRGETRAAGRLAGGAARPVEFELLIGLFDGLDESVFMLDRDRNVTYWNPSAQELARNTGEDLGGVHCWNDHLVQRDGETCMDCRHPCLLGSAMLTGRFHAGELQLAHLDGCRVPMSVCVQPLRKDDGEVTGAIEIFKPCNGGQGSRDTMAQLEKLAFLDSLTGLANRRYLEVTLLARLQELQRYGWRFGIIFIDVDNLKAVNDTHGHTAGDLMIRFVGKTFADHARLSDVVGRWGGDEFMAVVPSVEQDQLTAVAEKFRALIEEAVIQQNDASLRATVSIGATSAMPEDTIDTLVSRGDQLMFRSKRMGKNRVSGSGDETPGKDPSDEDGSDIRV